MTSTDQASLVFNWDKPYNGASQITSYTIAIRQSDEVTFTPDDVNCNGATPAIVATRTCTVPVAALRAEPYSLEWGSSVFIKVSANNIIGEGPFSEAGNGAVMLTTPEPPVNFANDPLITNSNRIGLVWEANPLDGGSSVIDYTLMWDRAIGSYEIYDLMITTSSYTVTGLTPSKQYSFKVSARNIYGESEFTDAITVLSAETPYQPDPPVTTSNGLDILISWSAPNSGGSPITSYKVLLKSWDGSFNEETAHCDASQEDIFKNKQCSVPTSVLNEFPYSVQWGESVIAKVIAINQYGESAESLEGNGALMLTNPDAPVNLAEDLSGRSQTSVAFSWQ